MLKKSILIIFELLRRLKEYRYPAGCFPNSFIFFLFTLLPYINSSKPLTTWTSLPLNAVCVAFRRCRSLHQDDDDNDPRHCFANVSHAAASDTYTIRRPHDHIGIAAKRGSSERCRRTVAFEARTPRATVSEAVGEVVGAVANGPFVLSSAHLDGYVFFRRRMLWLRLWCVFWHAECWLWK